jgi:hypothetical protein
MEGQQLAMLIIAIAVLVILLFFIMGTGEKGWDLAYKMKELFTFR